MAKLKEEGIKKRDEQEDKDVPKVLPEGAWLWRCFVVLSSHRAMGDNGPQPIALSDIYALSRIEGLDEADSRYLLDVVHELDNTYLTSRYEKIEKEKAQAQKKQKQSAGRGRGRR